MQLQRCLSVRIAAAIIILISLSLPLKATSQIAGHPVISEIYGGGGNSGALYTHDFIELYNPTSTEAVMNGWSVQYQSGGGTGPFTTLTVFSGTIPAHGFFLIQCNPGSGGSEPLPDPDAIAAISMAAGSGKVALVSDTIAVAGVLDSTVVDFVGYGSTNLYEGGGAALSPGNTASVERKAVAGSTTETMEPGGADEMKGNGWDSGDNANDFLLRPFPGPQNSTAPGESPDEGMSITVGYAGKWNLVSVPLRVTDPDPHVLFPEADAPIYGYDGEYYAESSVQTGRGYWAKFPSPGTVSFSGTGMSPDTLTLNPGWNIVGSIQVAVDVDSLTQEPPGHIVTPFYSYEGGYVPAEFILPGHGYWVKSRTGGTLILR